MNLPEAERVDLHGTPETMLGTLYGRALDARSAHPILGDTAAANLVERIDYDFSAIGMTAAQAPSVVSRALVLDRWARAFLHDHPDAVVLHLGCGLDTRAERIAPSPGVSWYDVDLPEVIELRRRLFAESDGYTMIGTSVTDLDWLDQVPTDRPRLVVAEGLTMYLQPEAGLELFRRLAAEAPVGEIVCDMFSPLALRIQGVNGVVRKSGATLSWGIADPVALAERIPRLRCVETASAADMSGLSQLSAAYRAIGRIAMLVGPFRNLSRYVRFRIG